MRFPLLLIVSLVIISGVSAPCYAGIQAQGISDFVVAIDDATNVSTIYVADELSHAIYRMAVAKADVGDPKELALTDLELFLKLPAQSAPTGIAYYNGKLLVTDRNNNAVFEIDTTTKNINLLFNSTAVTAPTRVAVSQSGRIAIANAEGELVIYERVTLSSSPKRRMGNAARIAFAGDDLLVLNAAGKISIIRGKSFDTPTPSPATLELPTGDIPHITDVAFVNGIYYLATGSQVYAYIRTKNITLPLFTKPLSLSLTSLRVNKESVVVLNSLTHSILQFDRPVAITTVFNEDSGAALIPLYEYLINLKVLPTRSYVSTRDYQSVVELLLEQKIVFRRTADDSAVIKFFCRLNKDVCRSPADEMKRLPIKRGEKLTLPSLNYSEVVAYGTQPLKNESVDDYLKRTFEFSPKLKQQFTADFLWTLNELSRTETLELQLQTKVPGAFIAVPPRKNLQPGSVLKVGTEQDVIAGSIINNCGVPMKYSSRTLTLPQRVKSTINGADAVSQLPRTLVTAALTKRLKQLGVTKVEYVYEKLTVELGDQKAVSTALSTGSQTAGQPPVTPLGAPAAATSAPVSVATAPSLATPAIAPTIVGPSGSTAAAAPQASPTPDQKTCMTSLISPNSYLVVDAVKVNVGRFKVFQNGVLHLFSKEELNRLGLLGEPDDNHEYSFVVNSPFYVAYRLSPWTRESVLQNPATVPLTTFGSLKPKGSQDIFSLKDEPLLLPYVKQWQFTFFLPESEFTGVGSDFNKLKTANKLTSLRAEETTRGATSVPPSIQAPLLDDASPQQTLETVTRQREALRSQIHFPTLDKPVEVKIGIGEIPCSVDKSHPDFKNEDGTSAWMKEVTPAPVSGCPPPSSETVKKVKPFSDVAESDHGTHVAGLIGARANTTAPGLVPTAQLFLVDSSSASTLFSSISEAVNRGVFIFNFSFGDLQEDEALQQAIKETWAKRLFVVAVDNEGADLEYTKKPPVSWMTKITDNMIGVGSSISAAGSQYVLGDWETTAGQGMTLGSSYGKNYVHLIAPGHSIYSTLPGNSYGPATGTSQAAPQVTAAAALLFGGADIRSPGVIKARLIYTSDWFEQLRGKVWGGLLNVKRAVWEPKRNLIITEFAPTTTDAIKLDSDNPQMLTIKRKAIKYEAALPDALSVTNLQVPFDKILRLTRRPNLSYRVIYIDDDNRLHIVLNAEISGLVPCQSVETFDGQNFQPSACKKYSQGTSLSLNASQILDYIASTPIDVIF
jgi:hypothetical protein